MDVGGTLEKMLEMLSHLKTHFWPAVAEIKYSGITFMSIGLNMCMVDVWCVWHTYMNASACLFLNGDFNMGILKNAILLDNSFFVNLHVDQLHFDLAGKVWVTLGCAPLGLWPHAPMQNSNTKLQCKTAKCYQQSARQPQTKTVFELYEYNFAL